MAQQLQASSRYAWRVRDADSVTFVQSVGVPPQFALQPTYKAGTGQQSNPYCNAGDVGTDHVTKGIHLGFDDSESPSTGPNWNTRIGESDFADLDPGDITADHRRKILLQVLLRRGEDGFRVHHHHRHSRCQVAKSENLRTPWPHIR
jgi:hypothetical protein